MRLTPDPTTPFEDVLPKGKPPNKTGAGLAAIISRVVEYDIPGGSKYNEETLKSFADEVMYYLKKAKHLFNNGTPILVLEPGRAIVDECMQLISKIVSKKTTM